MINPLHSAYRPKCPLGTYRNVAGLCRLANSSGHTVLWTGTHCNALHSRQHSVTPDVHGIYCWDATTGRSSLPKAIDRCLEILQMNRWYERVRIRAGLLALLEPFYARLNSGCAMVVTDTCREPFVERCALFAVQRTLIRQVPIPNVPIDDRYGHPWRRSLTRPVHILGGLPIVPQYLDLATPQNRPSNECFFRGSQHRRTIVRNGRTESLGTWNLWYLANPVDDDHTLRQGGYPTAVTRLLSDGLNPGRLMTWMSFHPVHQIAFCLCLDFDPFIEKVLSIRNVEMPLKDYIDMDPRMDRWLDEAIRLTSIACIDEQIYSPDNSDTN